MEIAVFSDIHGNATALHAVWKELEMRGLTDRAVLNAGDNVGYGDSPESTVQFLRDHPQIMCVRGNYDKNVASFPDRQEELRRKWARTRPQKYNAIQRDSKLLSPESRMWLADLPSERIIELQKVKILLTHYAPGVKEGLGRWTASSRFKELSANTNADVVVCGHTHSAFIRRAGSILWINPGSVGRSIRNGVPYAVLQLSSESLPDAELMETAAL